MFHLFDVAITVDLSFVVPTWSQVHFAILQRVLTRSDLLFFLSIGDCPEEQKQQGNQEQATEQATAAPEPTMLNG
jgi:hypothetical protein